MGTRTLYQLGETCASYVDSPADSEVIFYAISGILEGIDNLNLRTWNFQLVTSGFAFVAGQRDYVFADGIRATRHFALLNSTSRLTVGYVDPKSFFIEYPDTGNGEPYAYTFLKGSDTIRFNTAPNADSISTWPSGELTYYARIAYPASSGNVIDVPSEVERLLLEYGRMHTAERYDSDKVELPQRRFEIGFRQLRANESLDESLDWFE